MTGPSPSLVKSALVAIGVATAGAVLVVAAAQHRPGPRLSRKNRLVDLIAAENARAASLRRQLDDLRARVDALASSGSARASDLAALRRSAAALAPYAGLSAVHGPGIMVELRDSTMRTAPDGDPNDLVIHEQDLQAVVNAVWAAGAEAVAINGQRITASSAIRCVGNTLLLHGAVYSPPYRIAAVGNTSALRNGLDGDELVSRFRQAVADFRLGFDVHTEGRIDLSGFDGELGARFAEAA